MEGFVEKIKGILPALAVLTIACTPNQGPSQDERMEAALSALDNETDKCTREFEAAISKAMETGQVFEEVGDQSGEVVLLNDLETFSCIKSNEGDGLLCEKALVKLSSTNPNRVYLDRDQNTLMVVGDADTDIQVLSKDISGNGQKISKMFLTDKNCGISLPAEDGGFMKTTTNNGIVKRCATLRDNLKTRLAKVMNEAVDLKKHSK